MLGQRENTAREAEKALREAEKARLKLTPATTRAPKRSNPPPITARSLNQTPKHIKNHALCTKSASKQFESRSKPRKIGDHSKNSSLLR